MRRAARLEENKPAQIVQLRLQVDPFVERALAGTSMTPPTTTCPLSPSA
jgi:hypothetical protein